MTMTTFTRRSFGTSRRQLAGLALALVALTTGCADADEDSSTSSAEATDTLDYAVFTADAVGFHATSTLIYGAEEAILIDAQFNLSNGRALGEWMQDTIPGRELTAIYISHAHPDHFFAVEEVLAIYPDASVVATKEVREHIEALAPAKLEEWKPIFGDDLTDAPIVPELLSGPLEVEGQDVEILAVSADTEIMTVVHVPELELVVASDLAYAGVHVWLAEASAPAQTDAWLESLAKVEALSPREVVAGHAAPDSNHAAAVLEETADYIRTFTELAEQSEDAAGLEAAMLEAYPEHALPIILQIAAQAVFPSP